MIIKLTPDRVLKSKKTYSMVVFSVSFFLTFIVTTCSYAQTDTAIINNQKIACSIKEITPDAIKYTFPGEDVINTVYKNTVQKIIFKSGRVQTFAESTSYKSITNVMDYDNVSITTLESEVKGLYKLGDVSSKAKGTTKLSNEEKVKERAFRKLKIEAAMIGANVVLLSNQVSQGSKLGYFGSHAATNLTGIGYSNTLPDYDKFMALIGSKSNFLTKQLFKLYSGDSDLSQSNIHKLFVIRSIKNNNGIIQIEADFQDEKVTNFQLVNFTQTFFSIAYRNEDTAYNIVISFL